MKNIIITGGSKGIGRALVEKACKEGHNVFTMARSKEKLEELKTFPNYHYAVVDFEKPESINLALENLPFVKVDVLVNNAGLLVKKPFENVEYVDVHRSFLVNYYAPISIIQTLSAKFSKQAHIVNISTMGAVQGSVKFPELSAYGGTKASLIQLTEALAEEWKDRKISINALALGAVQTEMLEEAFPDYQAPLNAPQMAEYIYDFALYKGPYFNGKIIQVSSSTP